MALMRKASHQTHGVSPSPYTHKRETAKGQKNHPKLWGQMILLCHVYTQLRNIAVSMYCFRNQERRAAVGKTGALLDKDGVTFRKGLEPAGCDRLAAPTRCPSTRGGGCGGPVVRTAAALGQLWGCGAWTGVGSPPQITCRISQLSGHPGPALPGACGRTEAFLGADARALLPAAVPSCQAGLFWATRPSCVSRNG